IRPPADDGALRRMLIRRNPFVHSSVVMRRSVVERAGGYDERLPVAQDYDLWMRMSGLAGLANLPEPLVVRRLLPGRVTAVRDAERLRAETRVRWRAVRSGALRWRGKTEHIEHLRDRITLVESDLRDLLSVRPLLEQARPDYIVHLAAQSFVVASWQTPSETLWTNAICQLNLFEGMRQLGS